MRDHTANTYLVMLLEGMTNKSPPGGGRECFMAKKMKTMDGNTATTHIAYALSDVAWYLSYHAVFRDGRTR